MTLESSVVRIHAGNDILGTGFVIADNLAMTCAHVIVDDAGRILPNLSVVFHATGEQRLVETVAEYWSPPNQDDIAVLRFSPGLPDAVVPALLGSSGGTSGHTGLTFGFPAVGSVVGLSGKAEIRQAVRTDDGRSLLQVTSTEITSGFSGGPFQDVLHRRVIGMVTEIAEPDKYGRLGETAFVTPSETLRAICPILQLDDICPYRGLFPFTEDDAPFYFGRRRAVLDVLASLRQEPRFVALLGPSGSGKSSLLRAGVIPRLRAGAVPSSATWAIHVIERPDDDPLARIEQSGVHEAEGSGLLVASRAWAKTAGNRSRLVLVLDQFEEVFTLCEPEVRRRFLADLAALLESDERVTVIISMRDDFYSVLVRDAPDLAAWLPRGLVNVPATLDRTELADIIVQPASAVGITLEAGLVPLITADTITASESDRPDSARSTVLPLLEFTLTQLWDDRRDGALTHEAYQAIGRVTGGLAQWADSAYYKLSEPRRALARVIFTQLVHVGHDNTTPDTRRRRRIDDIGPVGVDRNEMTAAVDALVRARLLVVSQSGVELIHDALIREWRLLGQWLLVDKQFLRWRQELERAFNAWNDTRHDDATPQGDEDRLLKSERDLAEAQHWLATRAGDLSEGQRAFIIASRDWRDREQRRWQELYERAEKGRRQSLSRQLAIQALSLSAGSVDIALLLALEAAEVEDTFDARSCLLSILQEHPQLLSAMRSRSAFVTCLTADAGTNALAAGHQDGTVSFWDLSTQEFRGSARAHEDAVTALAIGPGGLVASGDESGAIAFWNWPDPAPRRQPFEAFDRRVSSLVVSPCERFVYASGGFPGAIKRWETSVADVVETIYDPGPFGDPPAGLALVQHQGEFTLVAATNGHRLLLWRGATPPAAADSPVAFVQIYQNFIGMNLLAAINDDASTVAMTSATKEVFILDGQSGQMKGERRELHLDDVISLTFSPDGNVLASTDRAGFAVFWNALNGEPLARIPLKHAARAVGLRFVGDGSSYVSGAEDGALWRVSTSGDSGFVRVITDERLHVAQDRRPIEGLGFSRDGRTLFGVTLRMLLAWDVVTGATVAGPIVNEQPENIVAALDMSPDGTTIALQFSGLTPTVYDAATLKRHHVMARPMQIPQKAFVMCLKFDPTGTRLAAGYGNGAVVLWDVATGQPVVFPAEAQDMVMSIAFNHDGSLLATGGLNAEIMLWDAERLQLVRTLAGHEGGVLSLVFHPDPHHPQLFSSSFDRTIRVWDSATGAVAGPPLTGHADAVRSLALDSKGEVLASGADDGTVVLWDTSRRRRLGAPFKNVEGEVRVRALAISPDGTMLATGGDGLGISVHEIEPQTWRARARTIVNRRLTNEERAQFVGDS